DDRVAGPGRGCDVDRAVELAVSSCPGRAAAHGEQQPEQRRKDKAGWTKRATEHFGPPPEAWAHSRRAPPAAPAGQRAAHPTERRSGPVKLLAKGSALQRDTDKHSPAT